MEEMQEQIQRIEIKVQQLLKDYQQAQKEVQRLQKENDVLQKQLQLQADATFQQNQKTDARTISASTVEDKAKRDLEKRINIYLKDIDKCLSLLHS